ncbi:MAG: YciI family protein [Actinomycetota bacterium]
MTDFLWLFSGGKMPPTEEARSGAMDAWHLWFEHVGHAVKDLGFPFMPMARQVSDGSVTEARAETTGYLIVQADSVEEVLDLAKGCPVLKAGTKITVFEPFAVDP